MTTLAKLTQKELAVLHAIDLSEYGEFLIDVVWSFTIADNLQSTDNLPAKSIPGVCSSLAKKGYTRNGDSDGQKTIQMTREGAAAYILANGNKSSKHLDHDALEAAGKVAAEKIVATAEAEVATRETKKEAKKARTAARAKLAKIVATLNLADTTSEQMILEIRSILNN